MNELNENMKNEKLLAQYPTHLYSDLIGRVKAALLRRFLRNTLTVAERTVMISTIVTLIDEILPNVFINPLLSKMKVIHSGYSEDGSVYRREGSDYERLQIIIEGVDINDPRLKPKRESYAYDYGSQS